MTDTGAAGVEVEVEVAATTATTATTPASTATTTALKCPDRPNDLGFVVPGDSWWPGQQESIDLILKAFLEDGKKYVLAGIPTGGGKTLIAAAIQRLLARHNLGRNSLALTHTIQLQQQYQKTLDDAAVITGRSNHPCELAADSEYRIGTDPGQLTAEDAPCTEGPCPEDLKHRFGCSYYRQWWAAADAPMIIMNYAYAARVLQQPYFSDGEGGNIRNPFRRDLLVMDECHLAEAAIKDGAGMKIWTGTLNRAGIPLPDPITRIEVTEGKKTVLYENVIVWQHWASQHVGIVARQHREATAQFESLQKAGSKSTQATRQLRARIKSLAALHSSLTDLTGLKNPTEWIIRRDHSYDRRVISITVQPLWGWTVSHKQLFDYFGRILLMSATPGDPAVTRVKLGIPEDQFAYIERPSTFKRDNRPVYYWPVVKLSYSSKDDDWERIAKAICWIAMRPDHLGRKGLVHSGSKANADRLVKLLNRYLGGQRAFSHGDGHEHSREGALVEFTESSDPRILVTASFTTGLDLPYIIGWQVIAKVPFGSLGDEITARRRAFKLPNGYSFGQQNYTAECANTVVQAAGRIVRAPDDSGPTFILDGNWDLVAKTAYLPRFFLDAYSRFSIE